VIGRATQRGGIAPMFIVDAEFADAVGEWLWSADSKGYLRSHPNGLHVYLHRFVWQLKHGECPNMLDHINCVKWDCRIENLRPATPSLNGLNQTHPRSKHDLPRGVHPAPNGRNPFKAEIMVNSKTKYLGCFPTPELASAAYEKARAEEMARRATVASGTCSSSRVSA
jgi:hypothetical protein